MFLIRLILYDKIKRNLCRNEAEVRENISFLIIFSIKEWNGLNRTTVLLLFCIRLKQSPIHIFPWLVRILKSVLIKYSVSNIQKIMEDNLVIYWVLKYKKTISYFPQEDLEFLQIYFLNNFQNPWFQPCAKTLDSADIVNLTG